MNMDQDDDVPAARAGKAMMWTVLGLQLMEMKVIRWRNYNHKYWS